MNTLESRHRSEVNVSAAVYVEDEYKRILLLQQAAEHKGYKWGPPGGGMEFGETPIEAAIRETREEIGVEVELTDLIGIYSRIKRVGITGMAFAFRGKISGTISLDPKEIMAFKYFHPFELDELIGKNLLFMPEYNIPALKDFLIGKSYPIDIVRPLPKNHS